MKTFPKPVWFDVVIVMLRCQGTELHSLSLQEISSITFDQSHTPADTPPYPKVNTIEKYPWVKLS